MYFKRVATLAIGAAALASAIGVVTGPPASAREATFSDCYDHMIELGFTADEPAAPAMVDACDFGAQTGDAYGCSQQYMKPAIIEHNEYGPYIRPAESIRACRLAAQ